MTAALIVGLAAGFLFGYARGVSACMPRSRAARKYLAEWRRDQDKRLGAQLRSNVLRREVES